MPKKTLAETLAGPGTYAEIYDSLTQEVVKATRDTGKRYRDFYAEVFDRCGVPEELRTPGDYHVLKGPDGKGYAVPTEIEIEGVMYDLAQNGATIAQDVWMDYMTEIGQGTLVRPGVHFIGKNVVGTRVEIGADTILVNSRVGDRALVADECKILDSGIADSVVPTELGKLKRTEIGPKAQLESATVGPRAVIGAGVELKQGSTVNADAEIQESAVVSEYATVGWRTIVDDKVVVPPGKRIRNDKWVRKHRQPHKVRVLKRP